MGAGRAGATRAGAGATRGTMTTGRAGITITGAALALIAVKATTQRTDFISYPSQARKPNLLISPTAEPAVPHGPN